MNSPGRSLIRFWNSSIGKKLIVALTGLILLLFLLGHMTGNLLVFQGRDSINGYAEFLHTMLHGWGLWIARAVLLATFVLHIVTAVLVTRENRVARDVPYVINRTKQVSRSAQMMIWTGLAIAAFVVIHLLHFTIRINPELAAMKDPLDPERHDVYGMVIKGFQNPMAVLIYIAAITLLCSHLSHGIASVFQTFGLRTRKTDRTIHYLGLALTILLWIGFLSIPLLVAIGVLHDGGAVNTSSLSPWLNSVAS